MNDFDFIQSLLQFPSLVIVARSERNVVQNCLYSIADLGAGTPLGQNFSNFMQFSGRIGHIVG